MTDESGTLTIRRDKFCKPLSFLVDSKTIEINKKFIFEEFGSLGATSPDFAFAAGDVNRIVNWYGSAKKNRIR